MGVGSAQCSHWTTTAPLLVSAAVALLFFASPLLDAQNSFPINEARAIRGAVKSSGTAIPGVTITAANTLSGQKTSTSTDVNGRYNLEVSANGRYVVRAQMAAFASSTQEVMIHDSAPTAKADFDLILLSRVQELDKKTEAASKPCIRAGNSRFPDSIVASERQHICRGQWCHWGSGVGELRSARPWNVQHKRHRVCISFCQHGYIVRQHEQ